MKARKIFCLALTVCVLFCCMHGRSEAIVQVAGRSLGSISDIVKEATGSDFPEIPKHSLLIYERHQNGSGMRYKSNILTINPDGSLRKRFGEFGIRDVGYKAVKPTTGIIERMDVAVSPKRFGMRRNVVYATSGLDTNPDGIYGYQTLNSVGTEDSANITSPSNDWWWKNNRQLWGVAALQVKGFENKDVVVLAHTTKMDTTGSLWFKFFTLDRNETGSVSRSELIPDGGDDGDGFRVWGYGHGIRGCEIAAGDIDGDGYKNEIVLTWTQNDGSWMYVYKVTKSGNNVKVTKLREEIIHDGYGAGDHGFEQGCPNAVVGDFDGDGIDEAAFVGRVFPWDGTYECNSMRVGILDYNGGSWRYESNSYPTHPGHRGEAQAPCQATRCDFDGDGKDEIAILFFPEQKAGTTHPRLERWYCDYGSIAPKRDTSHMKGGPGDTSVFGYEVIHTNDYYMMVEEFSITAGPLTGTKGKAKLAEDVAVSHINDSRSSVYVFPTKLDSSKNFAGFGDRQLVWDHGSSEGRRGAIITADFANEALMLDKPVHTMNPDDTSYVTVLQAMPYHIDNVSIDGSLTPQPINYTFSGFSGDDGSGKMLVTYEVSSSRNEENQIAFNSTSNTETISLLGDAGPYVQGYLSLRSMQANIAGNFSSKAQAAANVLNTIMDFVTDKVDATTEKSSTNSFKTWETKNVTTSIWDTVIKYSGQQHIWRYKILNNPLPSWYVLGKKADYTSKNLDADAKIRSLTFTLYDTPTRNDTATERDNVYQARHEEGNLFSYPSALDEKLEQGLVVDGVEGYNKEGELIERAWRTWSKSLDASESVKFEQAKIDKVGESETSKPSELSKVSSAVGSFVNKAFDTVKGWFGISSVGEFETSDIANLFGGSDMADSTTNMKSFTKSISSSEGISFGLYGRSTVPGEEAGYKIMSMPYVAREGTLKVAHAVDLIQDSMSRLWGRNSRYRKFADPSLVLPKKFFRDGVSLKATTNTASAMQARGIRYYIPALDMYSNRQLVAGLTYEISIPVYNASFIAAENFDVKLSYALKSQFNTDNPRATMSDKILKPIETIKMSLQGWKQNKGWAVFTWAVPESMSSAEYLFFVQIDPGNGLNEVHEERLDSSGKVVDVGGNNEGYFEFSVVSKADIEEKYQARAALLSGAYVPEPSTGIIYSAMFAEEEFDDNGDTVRAAVETEDRTGLISADVRFNDFVTDEDNTTFIGLLGMMYELAGVSKDVTVPTKCTVTYNGDVHYHNAYLQGVNLKPGVRDAMVSEGRDTLTQEDIESVFLVHRLALVPHTTTSFMINLTPSTMDWRNGTVFEFYVPDLAAESVYAEIARSTQEANDKAKSDEDTSGEDTSGEDTSGDDTSGEDTSGGEEFNKSSGGCDGFGGSVMLLGLTVLGLMSRKRQ